MQLLETLILTIKVKFSAQKANCSFSPILLDMKCKDEGPPLLPFFFSSLFLGKGTATVTRGVLSEVGDVHLSHTDRGKCLCTSKSCSVLAFFPY